MQNIPINAPTFVTMGTVLGLAMSLCPTDLQAQWTDDPAENTLLAGGPGDQVQPKMVDDGFGGFYLSWFSSSGGYDVYLQHFGADGTPAWNDSGLLVADRNFSSTEDYGLAVTPDGDAVLAYRGSGASTTAMVSRVSSSGTIEWSVEAGRGSVNAPDVAVASDGHIVAGWINQSTTSLQRFDPLGNAIWTSPVSIDDGSNVAQLANMQSGGSAGEVMVSFVSYATFTGAKRLKAQKVTADGTLAWSANKSVFTSGSLQFGNYPSFVPDGLGGGIFSWYNVSHCSATSNGLDSDGNALYGSSGTTVTASSTGLLRTNPSVAFDPTHQLLAANWIEQVPNTSRFACSAQRFDFEDGTRLWAPDGIAIGPLATHYQIIGSSAVVVEDAFVFAWNPESSFGSGELIAQQLDLSGTPAWNSRSRSAAFPAVTHDCGASPLAHRRSSHGRTTAVATTNSWVRTSTLMEHSGSTVPPISMAMASSMAQISTCCSPAGATVRSMNPVPPTSTTMAWSMEPISTASSGRGASAGDFPRTGKNAPHVQ